MTEIEPIIWESGLEYQGKPIDILHYENKNGILADAIKNFIEELYDEIKNKKRNVYFAVNILVPDYKGNPAKRRRLIPFRDVINENLNLPDITKTLYDYFGNYEIVRFDKLTAFQILIIPYGQQQNEPARGGNDDKNDCLYFCLLSINPKVIRSHFMNAAHFKKWCGLKRLDLVPLSKMENIENELKHFSIYVSGDAEYYSKNPNGNYKVYLKLENNHYSVILRKRINKVKGISFKERKPIFFKTCHENISFIECYDGNK
jgi:hypothetical protein